MEQVLGWGDLDPNTKDAAGDTALHLAARGGHQASVQALVTAGASLGVRNKQGETGMELLGNIPVSALEEILDSCILGERDGDVFNLSIDYPFLRGAQNTKEKLTDVVSVPLTEKDEGTSTESVSPVMASSGQEESWPETTSILFLTKSKEHLPLLEHPVITTFLYMKWKTIEQFYYAKFSFVVIFLAFVNAYIFLANEYDGDRYPTAEAEATGLFWVVLVMLVLFTLREVMAWPQLMSESRKNVKNATGKLDFIKRLAEPTGIYLKNTENSLRILLIISTYLLLFITLSSPGYKPGPGYQHPVNGIIRLEELSSLTILLSWMYALFFTANFPGIAIYATMFTTISKNFFKILLWLFWFVFAFALSFYFLFHSKNEAYVDVKESVIKTIVMTFAGELDFGGIEFSSSFSKFIFLLFIYFITLVFMNLLNGLAISDIGIIQHESEINTQIARIKIISTYEELGLSITALQKYGGFSLLVKKLSGSLAKFKYSSKDQHWKGVNCQMVPKEMLEAARVHIINRGAEPGGEASEDGNIAKIVERITKMEMMLEKISEKLDKMS